MAVLICTFRQIKQPEDATFLRLKPKDVNSPKVFCDRCLDRVGGEQAAEDLVLNVFVRKTKSLFDYFKS